MFCLTNRTKLKNIQFTLIEDPENQQKQLSVDVVLFVESFCLSLCSQIVIFSF